MMHILRWAVAAILLAPSVQAQSPADVSLTLVVKGGRAQFRVGEAVEVELQFKSSATGRYSVWTDFTDRCVRQPHYDHFSIEPEKGVADPLADMVAQIDGVAIMGGRPPQPAEMPVSVGLQVNEWLSIRQPGHYRITADSTRVIISAQPATSVPLHSNAVEIDVVAPEPGWAAAQLKDAVAVLERGDPPQSRVGQAFDQRQHNDENAQAARTIRFLETPESVQALTRFFENGPQGAQRELHAGLFASPYRREVIAAMEAAVAAPDVPITYYYLGTLMELTTLVRVGPTPLYTPKTPEEMKRWIVEVDGPRRPAIKVIEDEYFAELANSLKDKRGQALAISVDTLVSRGPEPASASVIKALTENFAALPDMTQQRLLTSDWPKLASLAMAPFLLNVAKGTAPARDAALLRLHDLDPDAARNITIDRIRKGDTARSGIGSVYTSLMLLPDKTLPELDGALVDALQQGKPVEGLIGRYASEGALEQLRTWFTSYANCSGPMFAYFFRVDPAYAADQLKKLRQSRPGACTLNLSPNDYLLMSPALEQQAIEDLSSPDLRTVRSAQTLLQNGGLSNTSGPLLEAMIRFHGSSQPGDPLLSRGVDAGFVSALLDGSGWVSSPEDLDRVLAACADDNCRRQVDATRRALAAPLPISFTPMINDLVFARVGPFFSIGSPQQLERKVAEFPKGTKFYIESGHEGSWYYEQHKRQIQQILTAAGMQLVDSSSTGR